jgi:hypothetical protein
MYVLAVNPGVQGRLQQHRLSLLVSHEHNIVIAQPGNNINVSNES